MLNKIRNCMYSVHTNIAFCELMSSALLLCRHLQVHCTNNNNSWFHSLSVDAICTIPLLYFVGTRVSKISASVLEVVLLALQFYILKNTKLIRYYKISYFLLFLSFYKNDCHFPAPFSYTYLPFLLHFFYFNRLFHTIVFFSLM